MPLVRQSERARPSSRLATRERTEDGRSDLLGSGQLWSHLRIHPSSHGPLHEPTVMLRTCDAPPGGTRRLCLEQLCYAPCLPRYSDGVNAPAGTPPFAPEPLRGTPLVQGLDLDPGQGSGARERSGLASPATWSKPRASLASSSWCRLSTHQASSLRESTHSADLLALRDLAVAPVCVCVSGTALRPGWRSPGLGWRVEGGSS